MTQMIAKFPGRCRACGGHLSAGDRIDWTKGAGARHVQCPEAQERADSTKARTPAAVDAPFVRHEKWEPCRRAHFDARLRDQIGRRVVLATTDRMVLAADGTAMPGDGAAYLVVGGSGRYWSADDADDMGDCDGASWQVTLRLRLATEDEAREARADHAQRQAAAAAKAARQDATRELTRLCEAAMRASDDQARCPDGERVVVAEGEHGGRTIAVLSADGGAVALWCEGYYDDWRQTLAVTREPRAVELFRLLAGWAS